MPLFIIETMLIRNAFKILLAATVAVAPAVCCCSTFVLSRPSSEAQASAHDSASHDCCPLSKEQQGPVPCGPEESKPCDSCHGVLALSFEAPETLVLASNDTSCLLAILLSTPDAVSRGFLEVSAPEFEPLPAFGGNSLHALSCLFT